MANEVWCLTVDHEKNPIGAPLPLFLENETNIAALRRKVKEAKPNALKYVNPNELTVWRYQSQGSLPSIDSVYPELLKEQVKHFFSDKHCLRQLDGGQTIKGLNIKSEETLMVQLPNNKKYRNDAEAETGNPSRCFQDLVIDLYTQSYREWWGHPLDSSLTTLPDPNDPELGENPSDVLPGHPFLDVFNKCFLVRAEYIQTFDMVQAVYHNPKDYLAVVTGQPGIGKTFWIYYAIRRCIGERQAVIWYRHGEFCLLSGTGVEVFKEPPPDSAQMWCFVDSTAANQLPDTIYDPAYQLFPIYVTSPNRKHWEKLDQLRRYKLIIMNPWTMPELEKAWVLYPCRTAEEIYERFNNAGPSACFCLDFSSKELDALYHDRNLVINLNTTKHIMKSLLQHSVLHVDEISHQICVVLRSDLGHSRCLVDPISPVVRRQLLVRLFTWKQKDYHDLIYQVPGAAERVGIVFESYYQTKFINGIKIHAMPMFRTNHPHSRWQAVFGTVLEEALEEPSPTHLPLHLSLSPSRMQAYNHTQPQPVIEENVYYVPWASNEIAMDSFIVYGEHLYIFQFVAASHHSSINRGLLATLSRFPNLPPVTQHHFIFVIPKHLSKFDCAHSDDGFLHNHTPYVAQVDLEGDLGITKLY